jgi:hypothetical protein
VLLISALAEASGRQGVRSLIMKSRTEAIIIGTMNLGDADKLITFFSR